MTIRTKSGDRRHLRTSVRLPLAVLFFFWDVAPDTLGCLLDWKAARRVGHEERDAGDSSMGSSTRRNLHRSEYRGGRLGRSDYAHHEAGTAAASLDYWRLRHQSTTRYNGQAEQNGTASAARSLATDERGEEYAPASHLLGSIGAA